MRERAGAAIGVIYDIILAVFTFRKFHEDWGGGASPTEAR
jgi:hypothetical protein